MPKETKTQNFDDLISDFSRFYILTILYEGPAHGYRIISESEKESKKESAQAEAYWFCSSEKKKA